LFWLTGYAARIWRRLTLGHPFKHVDLIEIAPERPAGFFNYFIERKKVFKRAHDQAIKAFSAIGATSTAGDARVGPNWDIRISVACPRKRLECGPTRLTCRFARGRAFL
jgi:hypothetical protein